ncbi:MAG: ABC transporter substrate-binding protein [Phycisphaerales bacterium JB063]
MRDHLPKIVIVLLMVVIVGLPVLLRPDQGEGASLASSPDADAPRLVIFTPHNEQIRFELGLAYNRWRIEQGQPAVKFDWRSPGGTSDIRKSILNQYQAMIDRNADLDDGIGADLFFGGGEYDHGKIAGGITTTDTQGIETTHRIVDDPLIDAALFDASFPEPRIGGERLYRRYTFEEDGETIELLGWTGVTLSSFGIVYNRDVLKRIGAEEPTNWSDLATPQYLGWVALADPGHSGSIASTFNTLVKRQGWTEGWATLRRTFANARYFTNSSSTVPNDVARGDAAAGMCIDFYARYQAGLIGGERMGYADPIDGDKSTTATTADPITLLRGAKQADLAREFIAWLLSPDAQGIWQRSIEPAEGTNAGAGDQIVRPTRYELRRKPIRSDMYHDAERATWVDRDIDPFPTAVPFPEGTPDYFSAIAPVTQAMAIDIHGDLTAAWEALLRASDPQHPQHSRYGDMLALFDAMPEELTLTWPDAELAEHWHTIQLDPDHPRYDEVLATLTDFKAGLSEALKDSEARRIVWRGFFQHNYREVVQLERGG